MDASNIGLELDSTQFDEFTENAPLAFIDFWNERCIPCKQIAPILDELALVYSGKIWLGKIGTDYFPKIVNTYGIFQLPTFCISRMVNISEKFQVLKQRRSILAYLTD